ncbi:MAG: hypothetical protein ABII82_18045 [Verrucomicrobiota bacterium]
MPDTKAVRTAFFGNGLAVLAAVVLLVYTAYKQYHLGTLNDSLAQAERIIADNKSASDAAIANFRKFQAVEKEFKAAEALLGGKLVFSDLVFHLGATLPAEVSLSAIDYRGTGVNLTGTVSGTPEKASGMVTAYLEQLRKDPVLKALFEEIELTNMSRNTAAEMINMELVLKFPVPKKPAPKKK